MRIFHSPLRERMYGCIQSFARGSETVGRSYYWAVEYDTNGYAFRLKVSELSRENFFADARERPPQFSEAARPFVQMPDYRRFPLSADHLQRTAKAAAFCRRSVHFQALTKR